MIGLTELIRGLRSELEDAIAAADGERVRFELGTIELETTVTAERDTKASGRIRFWVAEVGGDRGTATSRLQRLTVTLSPRLAGSSEQPYIAGEQTGHED